MVKLGNCQKGMLIKVTAKKFNKLQISNTIQNLAKTQKKSNVSQKTKNIEFHTIYTNHQKIQKVQH